MAAIGAQRKLIPVPVGFRFAPKRSSSTASRNARLGWIPDVRFEAELVSWWLLSVEPTRWWLRQVGCTTQQAYCTHWSLEAHRCLNNCRARRKGSLRCCANLPRQRRSPRSNGLSPKLLTGRYAASNRLILRCDGDSMRSRSLRPFSTLLGLGSLSCRGTYCAQVAAASSIAARP